MRKACWNAVLFIYFVTPVIKGKVGGGGIFVFAMGVGESGNGL